MPLSESPGRPTRVGIVGHGTIGADLVRRLLAGHDPRLELAFVHTRTVAIGGVDPALILPDLRDAAARAPDLIVEAAHPDITRTHGAALLGIADYLPLSTTALADDEMRASLEAAAHAAGTRLWLARGALVGTEALTDWRDHWRRVTVRMEKPLAGIDFAASGLDRAAMTARRIVHDGPVRGIAPRFPRNVNAMVTLALATIGLDRTRAVLIADPGLQTARLLITAVGDDGSRLRIDRRQPLVGVSGTEMAASAWASVRAAAGRPSTSGVV